MVVKSGVTKRRAASSDENAEKDMTKVGAHSPKSTPVSKKQKKGAGKQKRIAKHIAEELVQSRIRNKLYIAVILYVVIGGGAIYWYGLPKPKDLPPEVEMELMDLYPHEIRKEDLPKNFFEDLDRQQLSLGEDKKDAVDNKSEGAEQSQQKTEEKEEEAPKTKSSAAGGIGAEAVEVLPNFVPHFQTKFKLKNREGQKWKKLKILKNNSTSRVQIYVMDDFLSEYECNGLINAHLRHLQYYDNHDPITCFSGIESLRQHMKEHGLKKIAPKMSEFDFTPGTLCLNKTMSSKLGKKLPWSYSTSFYPGESKFSSEFDKRVVAHTGLDPQNGGKFQVTSYPQGVGYKGHHDCTVGNPDKRDRFATILIYLHDVADGGETEFPDLGVKVRPKKGRALLWNNMDSEGNCDPYSFHKATNVKKGRKYILQRWYYYQNFPTLGKRTPQPNVPARDETTARVSCDQYEFGSCRWYDEWTYDHITSYTLKRHTLK